MTRIGSWIVATMVAGLIGCGDQMMDKDYQGESLLRLHGSVAIPLDLQGGAYEPAIAWRSRPAGMEVGLPHLRISRVDVAGNFPANFTLDVFEPPPEEAFLREEGTGEPSYSEGFITAVAPEYPSSVNLDWRPNGCGEGCHLLSVCENTDRPASPDADRSQCYQQEFLCDPDRVANPDANGCQLQGTGGDQSLAFGGVSNDFRIVYISEPIAADTILADRFNDAEPLAAGYHIFRLAPPPPSIVVHAEDWVPTELEKCGQRAADMALEQYNSKHGKDSAVAWQVPYSPEYYDFERSVLRIKRAIGCPRPERSYLPVDAATSPILIQLGMLNLMKSGL